MQISIENSWNLNLQVLKFSPIPGWLQNHYHVVAMHGQKTHSSIKKEILLVAENGIFSQNMTAFFIKLVRNVLEKEKKTTAVSKQK